MTRLRCWLLGHQNVRTVVAQTGTDVVRFQLVTVTCERCGFLVAVEWEAV